MIQFKLKCVWYRLRKNFLERIDHEERTRLRNELDNYRALAKSYRRIPFDIALTYGVLDQGRKAF